MARTMRAMEDGLVTEVRVSQGEQVGTRTLLLVVEPAQEA
jgi:biotin carboxyl carrier protein